ncbi:MAG: TIGR01777 family oxidoreductase [Propionibacteriaceae bacterium]|nr:TIGR01777 family oxidoreductase [Propionibacteriaceae bacterium]
MKVLLTGASGTIGTALKTSLVDQGHEIRVMTRTVGGDYVWDAREGSVPPEAIRWAEAVVSLGGASLTRLPWTKAYRRLIRSSRVESTRALAQAIADSSQPPTVWISGSAVGIYGDRGDADVDETSPAGDSFLAEVVRAWERATLPARDATRIVTARTGTVLGPEGLVKILASTTRVGLGARVGPGSQWWPWVSLEDEVRAIVFALEHESLAGPVNIVGPVPATAETITRVVAQALHRPRLFVFPAVLFRVILGGGDELILASSRVRPTALIDAGFTFHATRAEDAVRAAVAQWTGSWKLALPAVDPDRTNERSGPDNQ